jgi:hypothetical protein|tara:strand:+ start:1292 stop:1414 length:123 start_codon:yes stop_codon:yes gene_type:complete
MLTQRERERDFITTSARHNTTNGEMRKKEYGIKNYYRGEN